MTADRYVRLGDDPPVIYPATLAYLSAAIREAREASKRTPGTHTLEADFHGTREVIRVFIAGRCTWMPGEDP